MQGDISRLAVGDVENIKLLRNMAEQADWKLK